MPKRKTSSTKKKIAKTKKTAKTAKPAKTIGILHSGTRGKHDVQLRELRKFLKNNGYSEPTNLTIAPNQSPLWSDDDPQKLTDNAKILADMPGLDLIIAAGGSASVYAAHAATATNHRHVVFTSFSQRISPASNMTGVCARTTELDRDRLTNLYNLMLSERPGQTEFGVLENQKRQGYDPQILQDEASRLHIDLNRKDVHKDAGEADTAVVARINNAFADWKSSGIKAALVCADPIFNNHRREVLAAARRNGVLTMHQWREFKDEGGHAFFGTSLKEAYQQAGRIAAQVLDGTDPADVPVYVLGNLEFSFKRASRK